jgi:hypothetical protein
MLIVTCIIGCWIVASMATCALLALLFTGAKLGPTY